jgi:hypothetical protein
MKKALLAILLAATLAVPTPFTTRTNSFPNEDKHHAMLRLEDVGPGGSYDTPDDLGKLRAVFEYLAGENVPFHVGTISRSKYIQPDGTWHDKGIDDPNPDETTLAFIRLLKYAQDHGAVLGMHGYSHQYGDTVRADNNHITGTAFEFNIKDNAEETQTATYAVEKITKALSAFDKAGFTPGFWESPHYHDTREQEEVFRSYMGVLYQPDYRSLRSFKDIAFYQSENEQGRTSLGSVYIPAPLKYVQDHASVDKILNRLPSYHGLAAMYYHPFLEFPFLEAVKDASGKPQLRDGLPVYRYKGDVESNLHRLVEGFRNEKYEWISLYDMLPFSPAHRVDLPLGANEGNLLVGDVTGSGHADVLVRLDHRLELFPGTYTWPRNRAQKPSHPMITQLGTDETPVLADMNGDNKEDLVLYNSATGETRDLYSDGSEFTGGTLLGTLPKHIDNVLPLDLNRDGQPDFLLQNGSELSVAFNQGGKLLAAEKALTIPNNATVLTGDADGDKLTDVFVYSQEDHTVQFYKNTGVGLADRQFVTAGSYTLKDAEHVSQLLASDTNGDGLTDLIAVDAKNGLWQVLQAQGTDPQKGPDFRFRPLDNLYGPWARGGNRTALTADFDGNGKADIASFDLDNHLLDLSLSFRNAKK